jgi:hypothetical protein
VVKFWSSSATVRAGLLARYRARQITSEEVIKALLELAKEMRDARRRHEELGLTEEEAACRHRR